MDVVTVLWLVLFLLVLLHADLDALDLLSAASVRGLEEVLFASTLVFAADLWFRYRWSGLTRGRFLRTGWLDVLMVVPFLRPLGSMAVLRVGRPARAFRAVVRGRRALGLYRKSRRAARCGGRVVRSRRERRVGQGALEAVAHESPEPAG